MRFLIQTDKYRKSYERECISWFMGSSDVLKVLKIARAIGECNLRTFKTSRVTINHEMHEQVHTIFYLLYSRQNYSIALLCTPYVLQKTLQWVPKCSHVLFEPIKNVMLWQVNQAWSSWKFLRKYYKPNSVSHFFISWCSNLALPRCFHGNFSVLHSITSIALYNLFMHSSLTNQKRDVLLSI